MLKHRDHLEGYRSPSWTFARILKTRPEFRSLDAEAVTERLDQELMMMFPGSPAPWVTLGLQDFSSRERGCDPRSDFLAVWDIVKTPLAMGAQVYEAAERAEEKPLDFAGRFSPADEKMEGLLSICYWLGERNGGRFFLGCRDAGAILGIGFRIANQLLRRAEKLGFLEAEPYTKEDKAKQKAKTYRFVWVSESPLRFK